MRSQGFTGHRQTGDRVVELLIEGELGPTPAVDVDEPVRHRELVHPSHHDHRLAGAIEAPESGCTPAQRSRDLRQHVEALRGWEETLEPIEGRRQVGVEQGGRQSEHQGYPGARLREVFKLIPGPCEELGSILLRHTAEGEERAIFGRRRGDGLPIAKFALGLQCAQPVPKRDFRVEALLGRGESALMKIRPVGRGRADGKGVVKEHQGLLVGTE